MSINFVDLSKNVKAKIIVCQGYIFCENTGCIKSFKTHDGAMG